MVLRTTAEEQLPPPASPPGKSTKTCFNSGKRIASQNLEATKLFKRKRATQFQLRFEDGSVIREAENRLHTLMPFICLQLNKIFTSFASIHAAVVARTTSLL